MYIDVFRIKHVIRIYFMCVCVCVCNENENTYYYTKYSYLYYRANKILYENILHVKY